MEFKSLKLSGNRFEIAPKFTIELNPEEAGIRPAATDAPSCRLDGSGC